MQLAQGRLATKTYVEEVQEPSPKKQKTHKENIVSIAPHFRPTDVTDVQQVKSCHIILIIILKFTYEINGNYLEDEVELF